MLNGKNVDWIHRENVKVKAPMVKKTLTDKTLNGTKG
jgi:hypothetical protein